MLVIVFYLEDDMSLSRAIVFWCVCVYICSSQLEGLNGTQRLLMMTTRDNLYNCCAMKMTRDHRASWHRPTTPTTLCLSSFVSWRLVVVVSRQAHVSRSNAKHFDLFNAARGKGDGVDKGET